MVFLTLTSDWITIK